MAVIVVGQILRAPWPIVAALAVHLLVAVVCAGALVAVDGTPILGVHPALKPLKFAVSIATLLASVAWILAVLEVDARIKLAIAALLASTMVTEMAVIAVQALRGVPSHFNAGSRLDAAMWHVMLGAILLALVALVLLIGVATLRPWKADPAIVLAGRAALWLLLLSAVSGFAMGGRLAHSVGGKDGEPGLPIANWSRSHGDLRVSHFFTLHGLQVLPAIAWLVTRLGLGDRAARIVVALAIAAWLGLSVFTLGQAFAGRPFLRQP